jgi:hypothetical protein
MELVSPSTILVLHACATLAMVGLIWFVQVVHYPLYSKVGASAFAAYHEQHVQRTTRVVAPFMLVELACGLALLVWTDTRYMGWKPWTGVGLLVLIWVSTAILQVPSHARLQAGYTPAAHAFLVRTNWIRTLAWTARGALSVLPFLGPAPLHA